MPVIFQNPTYPQQVGPNGTQAVTQQLTYRQMLNEVLQWNPDVDAMVAGRWINNEARYIYRKRQWYGLKVRGVLNIPLVLPQYRTGQATTTNGLNTVRGTGTAWDQSLIGLQFRSGFTFPWCTINNVDPINQILTLDVPFGGNSAIGGFQIQQVYCTLGANIKYLLWSVNQQQGWPMEVNVSVETLNAWDVWRTSLGWSTVMATRPQTPSGAFQVEVWPTPFQAQVFPFEAYTQPPDMYLDEDSLPPWIDSDVVVKRACAFALLRPGKYKDPQTAGLFLAQAKEMLEDLENQDNALDQQDVTWDYGHEDGRTGFGFGSAWQQSHD